MLKRIEQALQHYQAQFSNPYHFKKAAVLIPLVELHGEFHLLFETRAQNLHYQPGEICFPGGKIDALDRSVKAALLREVQEELGLAPDHLNLFGALDYFCSPLGYIIYPFCGVITKMQDIRLNPAEVDSIFTVPLSWLLQHQPEKKQLMLGSQFKDHPSLAHGHLPETWLPHKEIEVLFYYYQDKVIWGLTAEIIQQFILKIAPII